MYADVRKSMATLVWIGCGSAKVGDGLNTHIHTHQCSWFYSGERLPYLAKTTFLNDTRMSG